MRVAAGGSQGCCLFLLERQPGPCMAEARTQLMTCAAASWLLSMALEHPAHCLTRNGPVITRHPASALHPQELPNHFQLQPGPESRTVTFLWHCAHHPAHCPAPGSLQRLSVMPKQCQNITWELSFFNNRTGGKRTTTALGWLFLPQGKRWQVGIMGMGRRTFCSWHSDN